YFPDRLSSTFSTFTPENQRPSGNKLSKGVIVAATVASVVGFFLLLCLGEAL
ncbi:hypothetical protein FRC00_013026, partial [Tulasnella sp. 408]